MADEENQQVESRAGAEQSGLGATQMADSPNVAPRLWNRAKNLSRQAGKMVLSTLASPLGAGLLVIFIIILFVLILVFGLGVLPAAWKGFFGEKLAQPAAVDYQTRTTLNEVKDKSDPKLREAKTDGQVTATETDPATGATSTPKFCQLVIPDTKDRIFLKEGYTATKTTIGIEREVKIHPDIVMLESMKYLCKKHRRIGISHMISAYIDMKLDPEQKTSRDPQIIKNISAHTKGLAYDIVEIDFVYKVYRFPCPPSPNFTVEYWNDRDQLLLVLPCKEPPRNTNITKFGALAQAIPIQIAWQDQNNTFALGGLPLNVNAATKLIAAHLGVPEQALQLALGSPEQMLAQVGRNYLEQLLGLSPGALKGNDLSRVLKSAFDLKLAELVKQLPRPDFGTSLPDWARSVGAGSWEQAFGLFPGSLQGWGNPAALFRSVGLETAANALRIPSDLLKNPAQAAELLKSLREEDLAALGEDPLGAKLVPIVQALQSRNTEALDVALEGYGETILELSFAAPPRSLRPCQEGESERGPGRRCPDPYANLSLVAERVGIEVETLRRFVDILLAEGALDGLFQERGIPILESALGVSTGSFAKLLSGQSFTFDAGTLQTVASRLGVDTSIATDFLKKVEQNQVILLEMQKVGSGLLGKNFQLSDPLALFQMATGQAPDQLKKRVEQELAELAKKLNLPPDLTKLTSLFSGNPADLLTAFKNLGGVRFGDLFGLPVSDILELQNGDLSALLDVPAVKSLIQSITDSLGLNPTQVTDLLRGNPVLSELAKIGDQLNGLMSTLGIDQFLVMERVYKPEARFKVHLAIQELLSLPFELDNIDLRVTQLITESYERDVQPFETDGTLDKVYGRGRSRNFGLFSMKEAIDHLHIGY